MVYPYNGHPSWTNLGVRNLPRVFTLQCAVETRTHDLSIASPTLYHNTTTINVKKTYQFKTQCKGDISHAFETAKITVFDLMVCKTPDAPLQNELLY